MSVQYCDVDDTRSVISEACSCPPVPLRRRARMKKAAPLPPSKVTTPLSLSLADLQVPLSAPGPHRSGPPSSAPLPVSGLPLPASLLRDQGDECAINELLEGRMDLDVVLPDARKVRMNVERRTPMMDLLVQVTTAHKINPGGHVIHIPTDRDRDYLQYKPNTPIGSLDTNSIHIVPKSVVFDPPVKKMPKMANKPFEQTFRLQVNLPRNQLMVMRVGPRTTLGEVKTQACKEKNLDPSRYMLAHPLRPDAILDLNSSMSAYGATEITLMSNSNFNAHMCHSTSDLIAYAAREEHQKKKSLLGLFSRKKSKTSVVDSSSDSLDSRGVSPSRSDGSGPYNSSAKVSMKKRPAPPPPPTRTSKQKEESSKSPTSTTPTITSAASIETLLPPSEQPISKTDGSTVSHSRHSSDSSGYHEASLLSETPENHSPDVCSGSGSSGFSTESSSHPVINRRKSSSPTKSSPLKTKSMVASLSDTQLLANMNNKKRRAPLPPPVLPKSELCDLKRVSGNEMIEEVILEEPRVEDEDGSESKTPPPEPTSSPPISEAESGLVEDMEHPVTSQMLTSSPTCDDSPPASLQDSGLTLDDSQDDMEPIYSYDKGPTATSADSASAKENAPTTNPLLTGALGSLHEPATHLTPFKNRAKFFTAFRHWADTNNHPSPDGAGRRTSLTSLGTIDDVQNAFDLTIAEAEKVLEDEEKRLSLSSDDFLDERDDGNQAVIEESQNQILSQIEAAFQAVEEDTKESPVPQSPLNEDNLNWEYTIPEPPPAFRNSTENKSARTTNSKEIPTPLPVVSVPEVEPPSPSVEKSYQDNDHSHKKLLERSVSELSPAISVKANISPETSVQSNMSPPKEHSNNVKRSVSSRLLQKEPMSLPSEVNSNTEITSSVGNLESYESRNNVESQTRKLRRASLKNFTIGTYKKPSENIFTSFEAEHSNSVPYNDVPFTGPASLDVPKTPINSKMLMYGMEGSVRGIKGQVRLRCTEMLDTNGSALVSRSASMLSLTPTTRRVETEGKTKNVQRTSSNVSDRIRKAQSVQDLNVEGSDSQANLEQEQERLQQEYSKLHQQFLAWNQQLQDNQNLLEKQKIVSASNLLPMPVKEPDKIVSNVTACSIATVAEEVAARSQTLPRTKPKPVVEQPIEEKRTYTLERRPKSQILTNVSIGSWKQRQSSENISTLPVIETSQFHSLDVANTTATEKKQMGNYISNKPPVSKRPVSMYASWQKPLVDEVDKQKPKFDVHFSSNQSSQINSLRTSSTKTYFKPPEVKSSSVSRQRIPPKDIDSSSDFNSSVITCKSSATESKPVADSHMLKKFVYGQNDLNGSGKTVTYLNSDKVNNENNIRSLQVNSKIISTNGLGQRPSFSVKTAPKIVGFRTNGALESTTNGRTSVVPDPPTPPPAPQLPSKVPSQGVVSVKSDSMPKGLPTRSAKSAQLLKASPIDPREELMLEIRNFGGRKTLRKVPVNQVNWQLKVHGSNSTITA